MDQDVRNKKEKSRSGCLVCKRRRVKCDEQQPSCHRCIKIGTECPGYKRPVKWSTKYEKTNVSERTPIKPRSRTPARQSPSVRRLSKDIEHPQGVPRPSETGELNTVVAPGALKSIGTITPFQDYAGEASALLHYYFSTVCHVLSSFDSLHNPFRSEVPRLFTQSPLLLYCVLSMSAAHLYQDEESRVVDVPLRLQTKAISYLAGQLPTPPHTNGLEVSIYRAPTVEKVVGADIKDDVLLGTIILGMTSAWHDVSSTGLMHLHGSRELFKAWMSSSHLDATMQGMMSGTQNFVVSSMVYWEAMSSFITDQDPNALSYLNAFCHHHPPRSLQTRPCPWTGVGTVTFIYLAKTATLVRRLRALGRWGLFGQGEDFRNTSYSDLLQQAVNLKEEISMLETPDFGSVTDSGDIFTPPGHLIAMEQCYRLAALLELKRAFPELSETQLVRGCAGLDAIEKASEQAELVSNLALTILQTMEEIPVTSGTVSTQLLPLIIAGSVLGLEPGEDTTSEGFEFMDTAGTAEEVARWRDFVRMRARWLYQLIRLKPVRHGLLILEEVWARLDGTHEANRADDTNSDNESCHWIYVMEEKGLETMLG